MICLQFFTSLSPYFGINLIAPLFMFFLRVPVQRNHYIALQVLYSFYKILLVIYLALGNFHWQWPNGLINFSLIVIYLLSPLASFLEIFFGIIFKHLSTFSLLSSLCYEVKRFPLNSWNIFWFHQGHWIPLH